MGLKACVLYLLPFVLGVCQGCELDACQIPSEFKRHESGKKVESNPDTCQELKVYNACMKNTERACRGDLQFHLASTMVGHLAEKFNCTGRRHKCTYRLSHSGYRHCGLFGDPHLKTYSGAYQTCRIRGAWPLIDNRHLAVQVTNSPVLDSSPATATTKVTIIIKGREPCASEKTYEATADAPLPSYFIDGSDHTGPNGSVYLKAFKEGQNQKVEIYLRYIDTTLIIRRVGEYLGFSGRFPKDVLDKNGNSEEMELCRHGCPTSELLDLASARGHQLSWSTAYAKCKDNSNLYYEIRNNLTDHYLDWCVFDVMTAGIQKDFISAAHLAQADVMKLDPQSLLNRTEPSKLNQFPPTSSAPSVSFFFAATVDNIIDEFSNKSSIRLKKVLKEIILICSYISIGLFMF